MNSVSRFSILFGPAVIGVLALAGEALAAGQNAGGTKRLALGGGWAWHSMEMVKREMENLRFSPGEGQLSLGPEGGPLLASTAGPTGFMSFGRMITNNFGIGMTSSFFNVPGIKASTVINGPFGSTDGYVDRTMSSNLFSCMLGVWLEGGNIPGIRARFGIGGGYGIANAAFEAITSPGPSATPVVREFHNYTASGGAVAGMAELGLDCWFTRNFALCVNAGYLHCLVMEMKNTDNGDSAGIPGDLLIPDADGNPLPFDFSGLQFTMAVKFGWGYPRAAEESKYGEEAPRTRATLAPGAKVMNIAVSTLDAQNVSGGDAAVIADLLRSELVKSGAFNVVEKANMDKVLAEQGFQQTGCTSEECAVKLGKLLNVQRMIVGSFGKLMGRYFINLRVVDVESGKVIYSEKAKGESVDDIERGVNRLTDAIVREGR